MERGYYHPSRGYWQTTGTPPQAILDGYPEGTLEVPLKPGPDHDFDGAKWVHAPPPDPTPEELRAAMAPLSARQFRLGLVQSGHALSEVDTAIAAIVDANERAVAEIEWQWATQFERLHPLVVSLSAALGFTDEQVDALWTAALAL